MSNRAHTSIGTVRQLEILVAVYEERSFTKAAARLFLAQPSVSMQLSKLADTVGLPLYYSHARQVFFTEAGETMVKHARDILRDYQYLDLALSRLRGRVWAGQYWLGDHGKVFYSTLDRSFCGVPSCY